MEFIGIMIGRTELIGAYHIFEIEFYYVFQLNTKEF